MLIEGFNLIFEFLETNYSIEGVAGLINQVINQLFNYGSDVRRTDQNLEFLDFVKFDRIIEYKHLLIQFLQSYVFRNEFRELMLNEFYQVIRQFSNILPFFIKNKSQENIGDLINQYIEQLSSFLNSELRDKAFGCLCEFAEKQLIEKKTARYLLPTIIQYFDSVSADKICDDALCLVLNFVQNDFLIFVDIETMMTKLIKCINVDSPVEKCVQAFAMNLIATLNTKSKINNEVIQEVLPQVIANLSSESRTLASSALFFLASVVVENCMELSEAKKLIPKIISFLRDESITNNKYACTYIRLYADKGGFKEGMLLQNFIDALKRITNAIYGDNWQKGIITSPQLLVEFYQELSGPLELCNRLLEAQLNLDETQLKVLQEIASAHLKSTNQMIREYALNLHRLVFNNEEHKSVISNLML